MSKRASLRVRDLILKHLSKKNLTRKELMATCEVGKTGIIMALQELRKEKLVYICDFIMEEHRKTPIYAKGNQPDAEYDPITANQRIKKYREKSKFVAYKTNKSIKEIKHHSLIQWVFNILKK